MSTQTTSPAEWIESSQSAPAPAQQTRASHLKAAIIGAGAICEQHLLALQKIEGVTLAGVCDLSRAMADYTARRFNNVQAAYTDHRRMLDELRPDVVHVLTPARSHVPLVREALEADAHVLVEKPVAPTHDGFRELWQLAESRGRFLIEDHNYRFNDIVQRLTHAIHRGRIGPVREVELRLALDIRAPGHRYADTDLPHSSHAMPAGILHEFLTHQAYLGLHLLEPDEPTRIDRVAALWSNHGRDDLFTYDDLDALLTFDNQHLRIRFTCHSGPDMFALTVRGRDGFVETDLFQPYFRLVRPRAGGGHLSPLANSLVNGWELARSGVANLRRKVLGWTPYEGLDHWLRLTYAALQNGHAPPIDFHQMDATSRLVQTLVDAQENHRP